MKLTQWKQGDLFLEYIFHCGEKEIDKKITLNITVCINESLHLKIKIC